MGLALDTIAAYRTTSGSADTVMSAAIIAAGDSFTIRNGTPNQPIRLERFMSQGTVGSGYRVRSSLLHDVAEGIQFFPGQTPANGNVGEYVPQLLKPQDSLIAEIQDAATTGTAIFALGNFYQDLPGVAARLHTLADIVNLVKNIKVLRVVMGSGGAAGAWLDTGITVTEDLLHANTDYAVLGYETDTALCAVGVRGADTGNLRVCGPGSVDPNITRDYFIRQSQFYGGPRIPVFNSANKGSTTASAIGNASPTGAQVQLILAELSQNIS